MRIILLTFLLLVQSAYATEPVLSKSAKEQITDSVSSHGNATVIVGLSDLTTAVTLSSSSIKTAKTQFLTSTKIINSLVDKSIKVIDELDYLPFVVMQVNAAGLQALQSHSQIASIEADYPHEPYLKETVPNIVGIANPWRGTFYNGAGTWVAILDTGVNFRHPMFAGKTILQACFTTDKSCPNRTNIQIGGNAADPVPRGKSKHGTHVASVAVGNYMPAKQYGGVAPAANLIAVQVFDKDNFMYNSSLLRGLNYVYSLSASLNIAAANASVGRIGRFDTTCDSYSPSITTVIKRLREQNVATVVPNSNFKGRYGRESFPSCISDAIGVTGANTPARFPDPSNYHIWSNIYRMTSLIAPANRVEAAVGADEYQRRTSTSIAAALVSGAFAVLKKIKPNASVSAIETALQNTGQKISRDNCDLDQCFPVYQTIPLPIIKKAVSQVGGTPKQTTAIGFNTPASAKKLQDHSNFGILIQDGANLDANGVALVGPGKFLIPQTILTGRIAAKLRLTNSMQGDSFGILVRIGGGMTINRDWIHDGYKLNINNSGEYSITKYEHGEEVVIVPWVNNPSVVKMNDWNILMATTGGKTVKFYVNGSLVGEHSSDRLVYGASGVYFTMSPDSYGAYLDWIVTKSNATSDGYR